MVWAFWVVRVFGQGDPVLMRCGAVTLRVLPVESGPATQREVVPVRVARGQEASLVEDVLACIAPRVSGVGNGITLVSGSQDLARGPHALVESLLADLQGGLALGQRYFTSRQSGLA